MRKAILVSLAILGYAWPAAAQEGFVLVSAAPARISTPIVVWDVPQNSPAKRITDHITPTLSVSVTVPQLHGSELVASNRITDARTSGLMSMYEFTETPFVQHVLVPVISLGGGRVEVGGYLRMSSTENIQMGLPGCGTLPAWSVATQNHPAVIVPRADASAGFNISFRLHGTGSSASGFHPVATFNKAIAFVRGI
jgi:hypothetical protein